ncbi:glycosyltransferase [Alteromonas oceanisediminis]|uniref:glycosyltransferase n=1 Tax=Alteromonas oceanisediminis TaxID=2836180 RepID=UPI001BD95E99|nr:glycosyltransferase [Alteromonas oceanisediminis]MBT0587781.1 glycosyltransferase [Alteromonas oceanisediminis]
MKVLHLLKTAVGASWALRQTTQLVARGVEVHLALPNGPMVEKYRAAGVHVHILDPALVVSKPWQNVAKANALRSLVKTIQPDIVHSHFVATTLLMRIAMKGISIPRIFHIPGPLHLEHKLYRWLDVYSATRRDYYLASCRWTQDALVRFGISKDKVGLAYYGVNAEDFTAASTDRAEDLRAAFNWPEDVFLVGMVAYFYAPKSALGQSRGLKGHEDLIDAIAVVHQQYPQVRCVFIGGPWDGADDYYQQVQEYADKTALGLCQFMGTRSDVPQLYPQIDLAVHPSHSENVGGAVESMYANVLTLTTDVGGFPDLIIDGVTGYMSAAKDPQLLAKKIIQAIESPEQNQQLIKHGAIKVASVMNVEDNARHVHEFYTAILHRADSGGYA